MMKTTTRMRTRRRRKRREESALTQKSHGVGWLRKISSLPNSSWFGMVAILLDALIHKQDPGYGGVTTVRTSWNHTKALGHAIGEEGYQELQEYAS